MKLMIEQKIIYLINLKKGWFSDILRRTRYNRGMEDYYFGGGTQFIDISYLVPLGESNVLMTYLRGSKS